MASTTGNTNSGAPNQQTSQKNQPSSVKQQPQFRLLEASRSDLEECTRVELAAMLATSSLVRALNPEGITEALVAEQTAAKMRKFGIAEVTYIKGVLTTSKNVGEGKSEEGEVIVGYLRTYTWATEAAARRQPPYGDDDNETIAQGAQVAGVSQSDEDGVAGVRQPVRAPKNADGITERQQIEIMQRAVHDGLRRRHVSGKKAIYVSALMVLPEFHGKGGYGRQLLSHAVDMARDAGNLPVYLIGQPTALGFYQKMGFDIVETAAIDFGGLCGLVGEHRPSLMMFDTANGAKR